MMTSLFVALAGRDWGDLDSEHPCRMALSFAELRHSVETGLSQLFEVVRDLLAETGGIPQFVIVGKVVAENREAEAAKMMRTVDVAAAEALVAQMGSAIAEVVVGRQSVEG